MALLIPRAPECTIIENQAVILTHRISPSQDKNCPCHDAYLYTVLSKCNDGNNRITILK